MRQFLVDTLKYALLFGENDPNPKLLTKHDYFLQLLRDAAGCDGAFGVVTKTLSNSAIRK